MKSVLYSAARWLKDGYYDDNHPHWSLSWASSIQLKSLYYFILLSLESRFWPRREGAASRRLIVLLEDAALKRDSFRKGVLANPHLPHILFTGNCRIRVKFSSVCENRTHVRATEWYRCRTRDGTRSAWIDLYWNNQSDISIWSTGEYGVLH